MNEIWSKQQQIWSSDIWNVKKAKLNTMSEKESKSTSEIDLQPTTQLAHPRRKQ